MAAVTMVQFKMLRELEKVHSKLITLNFRRTGFDFCRYLLGRVPWHKALEGRRAEESW